MTTIKVSIEEDDKNFFYIARSTCKHCGAVEIYEGAVFTTTSHCPKCGVEWAVVVVEKKQ